jgi:hypothetical protein
MKRGAKHACCLWLASSQCRGNARIDKVVMKTTGCNKTHSGPCLAHMQNDAVHSFGGMITVMLFQWMYRIIL